MKFRYCMYDINNRTGFNNAIWKASDKKLLKIRLITSHLHFYSVILIKIMIMQITASPSSCELPVPFSLYVFVIKHRMRIDPATCQALLCFSIMLRYNLIQTMLILYIKIQFFLFNFLFMSSHFKISVVNKKFCSPADPSLYLFHSTIVSHPLFCDFAESFATFLPVVCVFWRIIYNRNVTSVVDRILLLHQFYDVSISNLNAMHCDLRSIRLIDHLANRNRIASLLNRRVTSFLDNYHDDSSRSKLRIEWHWYKQYFPRLKIVVCKSWSRIEIFRKSPSMRAAMVTWCRCCHANDWKYGMHM